MPESNKDFKNELNLYKNLLSASGDGWWDINLKTGSIYLSPAAKELLFKNKKERKYSTYADFISDKFHPDDMPLFKLAFGWAILRMDVLLLP